MYDPKAKKKALPKASEILKDLSRTAKKHFDHDTTTHVRKKYPKRKRKVPYDTVAEASLFEEDSEIEETEIPQERVLLQPYKSRIDEISDVEKDGTSQQKSYQDPDKSRPKDFVSARKFGRRVYLVLTKICYELIRRKDYDNMENVQAFTLDKVKSLIEESDHPFSYLLEQENINELKYCVHALRKKYQNMDERNQQKWTSWKKDVENLYKNCLP